MSEARAYPRISQAVGLSAVLCAFMIGLSIPVVVIGVVLNSSFATHTATMAVINLVAATLVLWYGVKKTAGGYRTVFSFKPVRGFLLLPISLTVIGMSILLSEIDNLTRVFLPMPDLLEGVFEGLITAPTSVWGSILALVVVAPITEELLFRGLILRGFLAQYSVRKSVLVSALLFALIHLNPWQFAGAFVSGVIFAWWFVQTRSLLPCLFGHALFNAIPLIAGPLLHLEIRGYSSPSEIPSWHPVWFDLTGCLLVGVGLWLWVRARAGLHESSHEDEIRAKA